MVLCKFSFWDECLKVLPCHCPVHVYFEAVMIFTIELQDVLQTVQDLILYKSFHSNVVSCLATMACGSVNLWEVFARLYLGTL